MSTKLTEARIELHYAAQILAACADAWIERRSDDGHTSMTWRSPIMTGERTPAGAGLGLRCTDLALVAYADSAVATFPLVGKTIEDGLAWADAQLGPPRGAQLRDYDLPASALRSGARFVGYPRELAELTSAYDAGQGVLERATNSEPSSSPIRMWPHHFDLGAILADGIGIGLSPGDAFYDEPYFYVTPAARMVVPPASIDGGGFWRDHDWQGAVLLASANGDPDRFVTSTIAKLRVSRSA